MSRAFVREPDGSEPPEPPPERPVPPGPNPVTPEGLRQIRERVSTLRARAETGGGPGSRGPSSSASSFLALVRRDLRYWEARLASARLAPEPEPDAIGFGSAVRLRDEGRERGLRIVGEDEADPAAGLLSWRSPLARALEGAAVGDTAIVRAGAGERAVEVLSLG